MPLYESQIVCIEASIKALHSTGNPLMPGLRNMFPDITFVYCDAHDIADMPYRTSTRYQLYLMSRSKICISLTDRLEEADGVIVVELG